MAGDECQQQHVSGDEMLKRMGVLSPIYFVTPSLLEPHLESLVEEAIAGGVGMVQLRLKQCTTRELVQCAAALLPLCRRNGVPLVINDRVDVCLAVGADGVHVGQDDLPVEDARAALGPLSIIGATTQTPALATEAESMGASYVAVGPMFASPTKPQKGVIGPRAIPPVKRAVRVPVCGIGGITADNIGEVIAAGAGLAAVVTAISEADDPAAAAAELIAAAEAAAT